MFRSAAVHDKDRIPEPKREQVWLGSWTDPWASDSRELLPTTPGSELERDLAPRSRGYSERNQGKVSVQTFKYYVMQGGAKFPGKKHYEGVHLNVISVTRGCVGVNFPGKKRYETLEWPLKCYYRPTASLQLNNKGNTKYNITVT